MERINLRLADANGNFLAHLPDASEIEITLERNDAGAGKFTYPFQAAETQRLIHAPDGIITAYGSATWEIFSFLLEDDEDDAGHDAMTARPVRFSGRGTLALFERGVILPHNAGFGYLQPSENTKRVLRGQTAGHLIRSMLNENQYIGYCQNVSVDFGDIWDSAGKLWDKRISVEYEIGTSLLEVITSMCKTGMCDISMHGRTLSAYVTDTAMEQDLPGVVIRRAHIANAPRKQSRRSIKTGAIAIGDKGWTVYRYAPIDQGKYGPRMGKVTLSNCQDTNTLVAAAIRELQLNSRTQGGETISLKVGSPSCPLPWRDFRLGDKIRSDTTVCFDPEYYRGYDAMRVNAVGYSATNTGDVKATVDLNDMFSEALVAIAKQVEASTSYADIIFVGNIFEAVIGTIGEVYALPGMSDILGVPLTSEETCLDNVGRYVHFERGSIYWTPVTSAHEVYGAMRDCWSRNGWEQGPIGYPMTGEQSTYAGVGLYEHFTGPGWQTGAPAGASIYWTPDIGAWCVYGRIREQWQAHGWEMGLLGYPITDELGTSDGRGRYNHFQYGSIFWLPDLGASEVHGDIRERWSAMGWERSILGFPATDELSTPRVPGRYNHFERGSIYWSSTTGAHEVYGNIRISWGAAGWEDGYGFPTSGEFDTPGGRDQTFERGRAHWDAAANVVTWS